MRDEVVVRRSFWGNALLILGCSAFVLLSTVFVHQDVNAFARFLGIVLFGGGGLFWVIFVMWSPIVIISSEGIKIPSVMRGRNFVPWKDVEKFEVVVQDIGVTKQKYIGIFASNTEGIVGTGKTSKKVSQALTGWKEVPAMLINLSFSFVKTETVMEVLQEFHDRYKAMHGYRQEIT